MNPTNYSLGSCQGDGFPAVTSRQPKGATVSRLQSENVNVNGEIVTSEPDSNNSNTSITSSKQSEKKSVLSVNANVFVPKGYTSTPQNTSPNTALNVSAPVYVPRQVQNNQVYQDDSHIYNFVMEEFIKTLSILLSQPGNMEEYMNRLYEHLVNVQCKDTLDSIVDELYTQCINEPNFRYTGARICQHMIKNLKDHQVFSQFRNSLLSRCKKTFDKKESLILNPQSCFEVHGLAMLMAELFLNLEVQLKDGSIQKLTPLVGSLIDLASILLAYPNKENIKCTVQMLKLAGASLDDMNQQGLNTIFEILQRLMHDPHVPENAKFMIKSVMDLRSNNWGRGESTSSSTDGLDTSMRSMNLAHGLLENEPVFYSATGQPCSRAEAGFVEEVEEESDYMLNEEEELDYLQWAQENNTDDVNQYQSWSYNDPYVYGDQYYCDEYSAEAVEAFEQILQNKPN